MLLYPAGKSPQYTQKRLGGPRSLSGCFGEKKKSPGLVRN